MPGFYPTSTKTRIETIGYQRIAEIINIVFTQLPLKQGLKHPEGASNDPDYEGFLPNFH